MGELEERVTWRFCWRLIETCMQSIGRDDFFAIFVTDEKQEEKERE